MARNSRIENDFRKMEIAVANIQKLVKKLCKDSSCLKGEIPMDLKKEWLRIRRDLDYCLKFFDEHIGQLPEKSRPLKTSNKRAVISPVGQAMEYLDSIQLSAGDCAQLTVEEMQNLASTFRTLLTDDVYERGFIHITASAEKFDLDKAHEPFPSTVFESTEFCLHHDQLLDKSLRTSIYQVRKVDSDDAIRVIPNIKASTPYKNLPSTETPQTWCEWLTELMEELPRNMKYFIFDAKDEELRASIGLPRTPLKCDERLMQTEEKLDGIHFPYAYLSPGISPFSMHIEDGGLCSINLLHAGSPKIWVIIQPHHSRLLESKMRDCFRGSYDCTQFVRHLAPLVSPKQLLRWNIDFTIIHQKPGQFVWVLGDTYHFGFNLGANFAEAINLTPEDDWQTPTQYQFCSSNCSDGPFIDAKALSITARDVSRYSSPLFAEDIRSASSPLRSAESFSRDSSPLFAEDIRSASSPLRLAESFSRDSSPLFVEDIRSASSPIRLAEDFSRDSPLFVEDIRSASSPIRLAEDFSRDSPLFVEDIRSASSPLRSAENCNRDYSPSYVEDIRSTSVPIRSANGRLENHANNAVLPCMQTIDPEDHFASSVEPQSPESTSSSVALELELLRHLEMGDEPPLDNSSEIDGSSSPHSFSETDDLSSPDNSSAIDDLSSPDNSSEIDDSSGPETPSSGINWPLAISVFTPTSDPVKQIQSSSYNLEMRSPVSEYPNPSFIDGSHPYSSSLSNPEQSQSQNDENNITPEPTDVESMEAENNATYQTLNSEDGRIYESPSPSSLQLDMVGHSLLSQPLGKKRKSCTEEDTVGKLTATSILAQELFSNEESASDPSMVLHLTIPTIEDEWNTCLRRSALAAGYGEARITEILAMWEARPKSDTPSLLRAIQLACEIASPAILKRLRDLLSCAESLERTGEIASETLEAIVESHLTAEYWENNLSLTALLMHRLALYRYYALYSERLKAATELRVRGDIISKDQNTTLILNEIVASIQARSIHPRKANAVRTQVRRNISKGRALHEMLRHLGPFWLVLFPGDPGAPPLLNLDLKDPPTQYKYLSGAFHRHRIFNLQNTNPISSKVANWLGDHLVKIQPELRDLNLASTIARLRCQSLIFDGVIASTSSQIRLAGCSDDEIDKAWRNRTIQVLFDEV